MHRFSVYPAGGRPQRPDLNAAHMIGADGVAVRGDVRFVDDVLTCESRAPEALGVSLLWPVDDFGCIQLETTRLPARDGAYHLHLELARHRLMRISMKREEWGLFDYPGMDEISQRIDRARDLFIRTMQAIENPVEAARLADEALSHGLWASEMMCELHASIFLKRRQQSNGFAHPFLGVACPPESPAAAFKVPLAEVFHFARVPFVWRQIQPGEHEACYDEADAVVAACQKAGLGLHGGPLLNFGVQSVPDWMYIWENDYEAIVDFVREHVRRTVQRYKGKVDAWVVAGGLHADSVFPFNFEQIMDLSRLAATTTKQIAPRAKVVLDLTQPWGEYYARNPRTVPPLLYAEMVLQSGIPIDAFGLQLLFGIDSEGFRMRDLLQVSTLLDRLANLGKPLHITAVGVPSGESSGGVWREAWSEQVQADWTRRVCDIALSKPFVESVCVNVLADGKSESIPHGGVLTDQASPKAVLAQLAELRSRLK